MLVVTGIPLSHISTAFSLLLLSHTVSESAAVLHIEKYLPILDQNAFLKFLYNI